jgi:general secretion pathway protein C
MMQFLKKNFWVLTLIAVVGSSILAAKGVNHVIEAKFLLDGARKNHKPRTPKAPTADTTKKVDKDDKVVIARNMFCSTCDPPKDVASSQPSTTPSDSDAPPITSLPLALLATSVSSTNEDLSSATVQNITSFKSGSYWLHEDIPDAGEIVMISHRYVDFRNTQNGGRIERIDLLGKATPPPADNKVAQAPVPANPDDPDAALAADVAKGVKKIDDTHYEIDRSLVDKIINDPNVIARSARIVPSIKDGKADGFKMYAIRPNSVYASIGMQNGDTIHSINGYEITSPDKGLEIYQKVKSANSLSVQLTRRGQPVTLEYTIK